MRHALAVAGLALLACIGVSVASVLQAADPPLTFYFIDVEGGQSTLIVTPRHQAMLVDAGYPGPNDRDVNRVMAAIADAGVSRLDYLLITHYHQDHVGGAAGVAQRIPVGTFVDHGIPVESDSIYSDRDRQAFATYDAVRHGQRQLHARPGDELSLKDLDIVITNGGGATLAKPLPGAGQDNPACATYMPVDEDPGENASSLGFWLRYGKFRFADPGDLNYNKLGQLACPRNLVGAVDVYLVSHHGNLDSNVAEFVAGLHPRVAIINNGRIKGGSPTMFATMHHFPFLEGVWQLHTSMNEGAENFPDEAIANLDTQTSNWLKLTADKDGGFTVQNQRNGLSKTYPPHR